MRVRDLDVSVQLPGDSLDNAAAKAWRSAGQARGNTDPIVANS